MTNTLMSMLATILDVFLDILWVVFVFGLSCVLIISVLVVWDTFKNERI